MLQIDDDPAVAPLDTVENLLAQNGRTVDVEVSPYVKNCPITLAPAGKTERLDRVLAAVLPVVASLDFHPGMMYPAPGEGKLYPMGTGSAVPGGVCQVWTPGTVLG